MDEDNTREKGRYLLDKISYRRAEIQAGVNDTLAIEAKYQNVKMIRNRKKLTFIKYKIRSSVLQLFRN